MHLDPHFIARHESLEVRAWSFRDATGAMRIPCQFSGAPHVPEEEDVNNELWPVGKFTVWVQQFCPTLTQITPDLSRLRGEEARLRVRSNFELLQEIGYTVVERVTIPTIPESVHAESRRLPVSLRPPAAPAQKPEKQEAEYHLIKATAVLATLATLIKIVINKWRDFF